jgi:hypothetical protein
MGTVRDWFMVALYSVFWGGWMLAWETRKRKAANLEPTLLPSSIAIWTLGGLSFGLFMAFPWKSFPWPLKLIAAASLLAGGLISFIDRTERSKIIINQRQSWRRVVPFLLVMGGCALLLLDKGKPIAWLSLIAGGVFYLLEYFESRGREA